MRGVLFESLCLEFALSLFPMRIVVVYCRMIHAGPSADARGARLSGKNLPPGDDVLEKRLSAIDTFLGVEAAFFKHPKSKS